jgi:steroid delta-isomerase-like uncharacterized protein
MSEHADFIKRLFEATNRQDIDSLRARYAAEFLLNGQRTAFDVFASSMAAFFGAFPDAEGRVEEVVAQGESALARWSTVATHLGDYAGVEASGRRVSWGGMSWYRFGAGRVVEMWQVADVVGLLQQIGALPEKLEAPKRHQRRTAAQPQMIEFQVRPRRSENGS